jgi:pyruvate/2-oxoglutarate dehydrogenase complex dihydrolipoamide acyltransferase (E2) component
VVYTLTLPAIEDADEVRVLEWHGAPGRRFEVGALVVELETHKALVEVRASQAGVLRAIRVEAGAWLAAGGTLAVLSDAADEPLPDGDSGLAALAVDFLVS